MEQADIEPANLLQDLDRRQNDVIAQLDSLNEKISEVLTRWTREMHGVPSDQAA